MVILLKGESAVNDKLTRKQLSLIFQLGWEDCRTSVFRTLDEIIKEMPGISPAKLMEALASRLPCEPLPLSPRYEGELDYTWV